VAPGPPPTVPPIVELTVGGLPYAESDSSTATVWTLYVPGKIVGSVTYPPEVWRIEARFGAGPSALARAEVADLVRSIRTEPPAPGPTSSPSPSATPDPTDVSAARSLADHFLRAFVAEEWTTAYGLLEPQSQAAWGGSVAAFIANWPHPAKDTGGHYTIRDELYDPGEAARLGARDGQLEGADLSRSFIFDVSFPNPQGFVPGPGMLLVAAPDATGAWRLWRLG
jgi:hypothetical protein